VLGGNLQSPASGSLDNYFLVVQGAVAKAEPAGTASALMAASTYEEGPIPADQWQHDGDSDGDGLKDDFEPACSLNPANPDTDGDGTTDESVVGPDGRMLWEVQEGVDLRAPGGETEGDDGGSGGKCGSVGLDLMAPLAALWVLRERKSRRSKAMRRRVTGRP
jgi:hypothetical protein